MGRADSASPFWWSVSKEGQGPNVEIVVSHWLDKYFFSDISSQSTKCPGFVLGYRRVDVGVHCGRVRRHVGIRPGEHACEEGDTQTEHARPEDGEDRRQQRTAFWHGEDAELWCQSYVSLIVLGVLLFHMVLRVENNHIPIPIWERRTLVPGDEYANRIPKPNTCLGTPR